MASALSTTTFGSGRVIRADDLGRRAWCVCDWCQTTRQFSVEALVDGSAHQCDCMRSERVEPVEHTKIGAKWDRAVRVPGAPTTCVLGPKVRPPDVR